MADNDIVFLGKKEPLVVEDTEFIVRGLTLKEGIEFGDILGKLFAKAMAVVGEDGGLQLDLISKLVLDSKGDIQRAEKLACRVTGKPEGFFMEQDPSYFSAVLRKIFDMTKMDAAKSDFTEMGKKLGISQFLQEPLESSVPTKDGQ